MANVSGTEINLKPTDGMKTEAQRYKDWKKEGRAGGTQVAAVRATQILSGSELSPDVTLRMFSFSVGMRLTKKQKVSDLERRDIRQKVGSHGLLGEVMQALVGVEVKLLL